MNTSPEPNFRRGFPRSSADQRPFPAPRPEPLSDEYTSGITSTAKRTRLVLHEIANDRGQSRKERPHTEARCRLCGHVVGVVFRMDGSFILGGMSTGLVVDVFDVVVAGRSKDASDRAALNAVTVTLTSLTCPRHGRRPVYELKEEIRRTHRTGRIRSTIKI